MTSSNAETESADLTFADLQIHPAVLQAVADVGYETPSPIQAATIPAILDGSDVVGLAQTGTGKTAAFAIPILSKIDTDSRNTQALVLAPTRELALQVAEAFGRYGAHLRVNVLPIYGGASYVPQLSGLKRGAQVVVGTPGRVIDHLEKGSLDLSHLDYLVLDEADEMLQMGFAEDVERILADTPEYKQVALFSATMPPAIKKITAKYLHDPVEVTVKSKTQTAENITQRYFLVSYPRKMDALTRLLEVEQGDAMIVFVRTKQATEEVAEKLRSRGFAAAAINGDIPQAVRERTISQLKDGTIDILVATDVAARGLDVERISHVVNFDIPHDPESYVHRIGRTGRAGRSGTALLFVTPRERHLLGAIERVTRQKLVESELPSVEDVNEKRVAKFRDSITDALEKPGIDLFRTLIEGYERDHDVPMADIAAALALQSRNGEEFLMTEPPPEKRRERRERDGRDGDDRGPRKPRERRSDLATYRIAVGKRHKVAPGAIVGAIANEGGLHRSDFGHITIKVDYSLVELPAKLSHKTLKALENTRIQGQLIHLEPDRGPKPHRGRPQSK
ncbi:MULTISPECIES: DEAD/DEAH box helicase [Mycolicibacterium]|jgi:ATP-dependent RNA helicase DeaD|uniref:ATP-dependent RNA helicase DeaD n=2 Tax=Mycolicibacterium TaxID=1866885 RepID=A1TDJ5_MYCVP|nr:MULTISPECIES: DEAD/DEAH box helicase [Mycolicibacterium]ABM15245.1 ATP-dependent RNA helicase CsdA [Mycolicibacterium vanbaalenii PYR-1]MCV7128063.1 DEAD/DEAH box helicase [Mycolicibacterium vanbaalenii PYR-1]QZT55604.1 DEAD/DEAH box helicase [Mycolicibacterium austroafricanum]UJL28605.1 DEAD/DEAH box helicase [Mycolicibacterium vanbaalenii]WND55305.1 DEAD/DEAH box helicase [Mycolicibacterium vanbaalenii]